MRRLATFLLLLGALAARGAPDVPQVSARFEPDTIQIGDHFRLRMVVEKDIVQVVGLPERDPAAGNRFTDRIEILEEYPLDTLSLEGRRVTLVKEYLLTTFEAGVHRVPNLPVLYLDKNITDTLTATPDTLQLLVTTFEIDTLTQTIHDIKPPVDAPWRFGEVSGYLLGGVALAGLIVAAVWLYLRWRKNRPRILLRRQVAPHVAAIEALEAVHHQKLWQAGKHKLYHSLLTDIVRGYIEARYGAQAMEMTSDELLAAMQAVPLEAAARARLESMLRLADLVKFAKFAPDPGQNEAAYNDAYYFVEETKPAEAEADFQLVRDE